MKSGLRMVHELARRPRRGPVVVSGQTAERGREWPDDSGDEAEERGWEFQPALTARVRRALGR